MATKKRAGKSDHSRRTALRFKLANKPITYMANGKLARAILQNISTSGCYVTNNSTKIAVNDQLLIVIELAMSDRPLELKAKAIRVDGTGFSAEFTDIEDSFLTEFSTMLAIENRNSLTNLIPITK